MSVRTETVEVEFKLKLKKDLQENEEICPKCGGTGLQVNDHPYGLKSERGQHNEMFPYKKQTIVGCSHCYSGVQKKCQHCQQLMGRTSQCKCDGYRNESNRKLFEKDMERWNKAKKITFQESLDQGIEYFYIDSWDEYHDLDSLHDKINDLLEDMDEDFTIDDIKDLRVYTTYIESISLSADSILERACENLHDEACERISQSKFDELQDLLNEFVKGIESDTKTYHADWKVAVVLTPEDFK